MRCVCLWCLVGIVAASCLAGEVKLDYRQREALKRQTWNMGDIEKKIPAATGADAAKIQIKRLDAVLDDLTKNNCPDENAEVKALKDRVESARTKLSAVAGAEVPAVEEPVAEKPAPGKHTLDEIKAPLKTGNHVPSEPSAVKPEPAKTAPAAPAIKLDYQQQKALRDGENYCREVEQMLAPIAKFARILDAKGLDTKSCTSGSILGAKNEAASIATKIGNIENRLKGLPEKHADVAKLAQDTTTAKEGLAGATKSLDAWLPKFQARENDAAKAASATFPADLAKAKALNYGYRMPAFKTNPEAAAQLLKDLDANLAWAESTMATYATTNQATTMAMQCKPLIEYGKEYRAKAEAYATEAYQTAKAQLKRAEDMGAKAVAQQKPAFFGGGIRQCQDEARKALAYLKLAPGQEKQAAEIEQEMARAKTALDAQYKQLEKEIIAAVTMPANIYSGPDKATLETMIRDAWTKAWPKEEILAVRFSGNWQRKEAAHWNSGGQSWEYTDTSVLPVRVIVRESEEHAIIYVAYINKDNLSDTMNAGVKTRDGSYVVEKMLMKNVTK